ncbi:MAG: DUF1559 domain-containing protein [Planctomycetia bacterium]|nr:DUF1559 domain-containing protein [Planctomycetia bacterium]
MFAVRLGMDLASRFRRRGMTLVELLVVVAIVGAIVALLLPAAQAARESARRTTCINNLRTVGCALHGYLIARRTFPIGCVEWKPGMGGAERCLAWSAYILPWLEQQAVADRLNLGKPYDDPANAVPAATAMPVFICPTADRVGPMVAGFGRGDYGGITGERIRSPNNPEKGAMVHDRCFAERDVTDGLSKTLFIGECASGPWDDGQWINGRNLFDQAYAINWPTGEDELRSRHPQGAQGLAGDGSVHFIVETVSTRILASACTRAKAEMVETPW